MNGLEIYKVKGVNSKGREMKLRIVVTLFAFAFVWLSRVLLATETSSLSADDAFRRLKEGNQRFVIGKENDSNYVQRRSELANGQKPFAIVVSCSDSRVGPEVVLDQGLGDIFVVRSAGHIVDDVALGSIEYAIEHLGSTLILVLGHERCGAVASAVAGGEASGHLADVVDPIKPVVDDVKNQPGDITENSVRANVRRVVNQLKGAGPILSERIQTGKLKIVGARYDLDTGEIEVLE
jgi:carbonic anhydrase